jgi:hypothetical protein
MRTEVVVVDLAEISALRQLANLAHRIRVDEGVVDHQHEAALLGLVDEAQRLFLRSRSSAFSTSTCLPARSAAMAEVESAWTPASQRRPHPQPDLVSRSR